MHQSDERNRPGDPRRREVWRPSVPSFILVIEIENPSQEAHDQAHARLHHRAALINPYYYCQTCGMYLGWYLGVWERQGA